MHYERASTLSSSASCVFAIARWFSEMDAASRSKSMPSCISNASYTGVCL